MDLENVNIYLEDDLCERLDVEGAVINPSDLQSGLLVMSSKDDTFTLHVFKLTMGNDSEYQIEKEICSQTYPSYTDMVNFLDSLTTFKTEDFSEFLKRFDQDQ